MAPWKTNGTLWVDSPDARKRADGAPWKTNGTIRRAYNRVQTRLVNFTSSTKATAL